MSLDWMARASCAGSELDFYEFTNDMTTTDATEGLDWSRFGPLVETCTACPVIRECAAYAMRREAIETHGCWAGTTGTERMKLRSADDPVEAVVGACNVNVLKYRKELQKGKQVALAMTGTDC